MWLTLLSFFFFLTKKVLLDKGELREPSERPIEREGEAGRSPQVHTIIKAGHRTTGAGAYLGGGATKFIKRVNKLIKQ